MAEPSQSSTITGRGSGPRSDDNAGQERWRERELFLDGGHGV